MAKINKPLKGRGAQSSRSSAFLKHSYTTESLDGIDEEWEINSGTVYLTENARKIVNKLKSPDVGGNLSMNPYQGCEHGCVYCYARNSHEYYGFSAGIDFESKILHKPNADKLLREFLGKRNYIPEPILLAGNTDCYQPAEKKLGLTRKLLEVLFEYKHPVSIITKNSLIIRDIDILKEMAALQLVHVNISVTTLNEELRRNLEPRTASGIKRLDTIRKLSDAGIPVRVMAAPMIPFLNSPELPAILEAAAQAGALDAGYLIVRLNGAVGPIFEDWIRIHYPDQADRVLENIKSVHGGKLSDSRFGTRMKGEGRFAESLADLFRTCKNAHFKGKSMPAYRTDIFKYPESPFGQLSLF
jgi:DNA repair photolyase